MKYPILILHGWGRFEPGQHKFREVRKLLEKKGLTVFTPDLPGFGSNTLKKEELFFDDYIFFVRNFLEKHKLKKVILVGHSFGGRIAIAFSAKYPEYISKLILVAPSGIPHKLSLKKRVVQFISKPVKFVFALPVFHFVYEPMRKILYRSIGEMDYIKAGKLQETFRNVYNISIVDYLSKIKAPTLIVWGKKDTFVPVADGELMRQKIKNAKLIIEKNEGHKYPYEKPEKFVQSILPFIA